MYDHVEDSAVGAAHACPPCLPRAGLPPGLPKVFPVLLPARGALVVLFPPVMFSHALSPMCEPAGPSLHTLSPPGVTHPWACSIPPFQKASQLHLRTGLQLTAAQSLTAVLISDLKLLDLVTPSSLGRSVFIIIVCKEGLGDY